MVGKGGIEPPPCLARYRFTVCADLTNIRLSPRVPDFHRPAVYPEVTRSSKPDAFAEQEQCSGVGPATSSKAICRVSRKRMNPPGRRVVWTCESTKGWGAVASSGYRWRWCAHYGCRKKGCGLVSASLFQCVRCREVNASMIHESTVRIHSSAVNIYPVVIEAWRRRGRRGS